MSLIQIVAYLGTFIFAIAGTLKAKSFKMDIFGGFVLAFASAYGGGTVRDILLGIKPVNWINDYKALYLVIIAVVIVFIFSPNSKKYKKIIFITDAIGIGLFTILGIEIAISNHINDGYALILGVISATFGGLIADILSNQIPDLLKRGELYATACIAGGFVYIMLQKVNWSHDVEIGLSIFLVVAIRIFSKIKRLSLPMI